MTTPNDSKLPSNASKTRGEVDVQCLVQHLDLFSGIGGFALAAKWVGGIETIGFCEIDPWAQKVLKKNFPNVPIHGDVKTLDPKNYGRIDLITGGYPCQPFSQSGKRKGEDDDRHLWPEVFRIIKAARPRWVLCENVAGHIDLGLDEVITSLEGQGYSAEAIIIPACAVGAEHRRDRIWIIANSECGNGSKLGLPRALVPSESREASSGFMYARDFGMGWNTESRILRSRDGISFGMDRLRGLGNAIVPQVAAEILRAMMTTDSLLNAKADRS